MTLFGELLEEVRTYLKLSAGSIVSEGEDNVVVDQDGNRILIKLWLPTEGREQDAYQVLRLGQGTVTFEGVVGELQSTLQLQSPEFWESFFEASNQASASKIQIFPFPPLGGGSTQRSNVTCRIVLPLINVSTELIAFGIFHVDRDCRHIRSSMGSFITRNSSQQ